MAESLEIAQLEDLQYPFKFKFPFLLQIPVWHIRSSIPRITLLGIPILCKSDNDMQQAYICVG